MKSIVVYESHYGHTAYVADRFLEALKKKGEAQVFELLEDTQTAGTPANIENKAKSRGVAMEQIPCDMRNYDCLCLCIPIWDKCLASPLAGYIERCVNTNAKNVICCQIYGDKKDNKVCFDYVKKALEGKGKPKISGVFINWRDVHNERLLNKLINKTINKIV